MKRRALTFRRRKQIIQSGRKYVSVGLAVLGQSGGDGILVHIVTGEGGNQTGMKREIKSGCPANGVDFNCGIGPVEIGSHINR